MERYLDFDLVIEQSGTGYRSKVINSPSGQASAQFNLPFSKEEIEILLLRVGRPRRGVRRTGSPEEEAVKTFGRRLFEAAFDEEVRDCFLSSLDDADRQNTGLRIRLRLSNAPDIADLPWEYLYYAPKKRFFSLSRSTPVIRYLDLPERIRPLKVQSPLHILVMVASPVDYPPLDVEQEWSKLKEALADVERQGQIVLERLPQPTLGCLQRRLRRGDCHVFHFVGHGGFDSRTEEGKLVLEDEQGRGHEVSGDILGTLLHDHRQLRLVVLNACEGARNGRHDPFSGTAQSLVQQGISAVIAMQFEITDTAAITFAHEFYLAIAEGFAIETALAEARRRIYALNNDVEWGTPVLYLRASDGHIFDIRRGNLGAPERKIVQGAAKAARKPVQAKAVEDAEQAPVDDGHGRHGDVEQALLDEDQRQRDEFRQARLEAERKRLEEDAKRKAEQARLEEAQKRREAEQAKQDAERKRLEEEAKRQAKQVRLEAERKRLQDEADRKQREQEARQAELAEKKRQQEAADRQQKEWKAQQAQLEEKKRRDEEAEQTRLAERKRLQIILAERRQRASELAEREMQEAEADRKKRIREAELRETGLREAERKEKQRRRNVLLRRLAAWILILIAIFAGLFYLASRT